MFDSMMPALIIPVLIVIDGLVCILLAVFAHQIGLDPTITWGRSRLTLLLAGIILVCMYPGLRTFMKGNTRLFGFLESETAKTFFLLVHVWGIIFLAYAWLATYGNFTTWDHTTHYYTQLADAFGKGHPYVDLKPGRDLAEAPNPYHPTERPSFSDEIWDMSLYKGKLFLYWGPVPALLIMPIQSLLMKKVTDNYLVFFFFAGLLIVNSLILLRLRRSFFPEISLSVLVASVVLLGFIVPMPWSLATPNVYEAAIGAGQFFLLGGLYFVLVSIEQEGIPHARDLFFAGLLLACAVGSRAINVFSVIFIAALTSFWIARRLGRPAPWGKFARATCALYVPLIIGAVLLGWYNWARFDSPLEFGLRYQITIFDLNKDMGLVFRPDYVPLNAYAYLLQPFQAIPRFPFIQPVIVSELLHQRGIISPYLYAAGRLSGLLFSAPVLVFSLVHFFPRNIRSRPNLVFTDPRPYDLVILLLAGCFLINFLYLLFCFFGQMRYLVDVISPITLLAIMGYWRMFPDKRAGISVRQRWTVSLASCLMLFTICAGLLLALTGESNRMQTLNPEFFDKVNNVLRLSQ